MRPAIGGRARTYRAITQAEWDLLQACIRVREEIDRLPNGILYSTDPEYRVRSALFDRLHDVEAAAWERLKKERAG